MENATSAASESERRTGAKARLNKLRLRAIHFVRWSGRMRGSYSQIERVCDACGEKFWGTEAALYCSKPCRQRSWRARQTWTGLREVGLPGLCAEVVERGSKLGGASYSKLLPRLFRATAAELRKRGWDPIELLINRPEDPASESDAALGEMEGASPPRRRWHYPPEVELERLDAMIAERLKRGAGVTWFLERRAQIAEYLAGRDAAASVGKTA
jgi:hypothetical protein